MALPKPTIVIFDMDGTTVRHLNPTVLHILESIDNFFFRVTKLAGWVFRRKEEKKPLPKYIEEEIEPPIKERKEKKLLVHRALHKFRRKPVEQMVEPCPGVIDVLKFLQSKKIPLCLASNGLGQGYGHDILEKFDLEKYFKSTIFREDVDKSKPHPEGLLLALERAEIKPGKKDVIWHIGDRYKDVTATITARAHLPCQVVPIAYGINAAVGVLEKGGSPENIIVHYGEMLRRLKKMFS